jgi:DNA-binding transcriptional ArsR family regulator
LGEGKKQQAGLLLSIDLIKKMLYYWDMDVFSALSDPTRRSILEMLASSGHLSATDIYDHFEASHPAISQHLKVLRAANLVTVEKKAQYRYYRLNPQPMHELETWIQKMTNLWDERFEALDKVLKEEQEKLIGKTYLEGDENHE